MIKCPKCGLPVKMSPFLMRDHEANCALCGWHYEVKIIDGQVHLFWDDMFILEVNDD